MKETKSQKKAAIKDSLGREILSYAVITLGILVYTFAWSAFMLPAKIVGGGVSGISSTSPPSRA